MQMVVKKSLILLSSSVLTISFLKDSTRFIFWVCFLIYPFRNYNKFLVRLELLQLFCLLQGLQFLWMPISAIIVRVKAIKLFFSYSGVHSWTFWCFFTITGIMYELQNSSLQTCGSPLAQLIGELPFVNRKLFCNPVADE